MMGTNNRRSIHDYIEEEVLLADQGAALGDTSDAFRHLERAHVLGQAITYEHTRVHWRMLKLGWSRRDPAEIFGQLIRIVGAVTKTPFGIYPKGNTGGANVYFFKPMPIADDLQSIIDKTREGRRA
jgi:hypothetical protein